MFYFLWPVNVETPVTATVSIWKSETVVFDNPIDSFRQKNSTTSSRVD